MTNTRPPLEDAGSEIWIGLALCCWLLPLSAFVGRVRSQSGIGALLFTRTANTWGPIIKPQPMTLNEMLRMRADDTALMRALRPT
jgi:hypothetical protein